MRMVSHLALAVGLLVTGCGASMTELVAQGRYYDACDSFEEDDPQADELNDYLMGEIAQRVRADVTTHVFTPAEVGELLPHVPAQMASGEVVLVASDATYEGGDFWELSLDTLPLTAQSTGRPFSCCSVGEWMALDGRSEEWEEMRPKYEAAQREARERRARYSGPLGAFRAVGELFAGAAADILLIGTIGVLDVDVSDLPLAGLSGIQAMRAVGERVHASMSGRLPEGPDDEEAALAARRAESLAILAQLLTEEDTCVLAETVPTCRTVRLYQVPEGQPVTEVDTYAYGMVMNEESFSCDIGASTQAPVEDARRGQSFGELFARTAPPAQ